MLGNEGVVLGRTKGQAAIPVRGNIVRRPNLNPKAKNLKPVLIRTRSVTCRSSEGYHLSCNPHPRHWYICIYASPSIPTPIFDRMMPRHILLGNLLPEVQGFLPEMSRGAPGNDCLNVAHAMTKRVNVPT